MQVRSCIFDAVCDLSEPLVGSTFGRVAVLRGGAELPDQVTSVEGPVVYDASGTERGISEYRFWEVLLKPPRLSQPQESTHTLTRLTPRLPS